MGKLVIRFLQLSSFILLLGGVSWGLLQGYAWLLHTPGMQIEQIRISGNQHFDDGQIAQMSGIEPGANILAVHIKKVKDALEHDPWIDAARVRRELPHTVHIAVKEREPAFWIQKDDAVYYADQEGRSIGPVLAEDFVSLPHLVFDKGSALQSRKLKALCRQFDGKAFPFSLAESSWLRFVAGGEIVEFFLQGRNMTVRLNTDALQVNINSLRKIWRDLDHRRELEETFMIWTTGHLGWVKKENQV